MTRVSWMLVSLLPPFEVVNKMHMLPSYSSRPVHAVQSMI